MEKQTLNIKTTIYDIGENIENYKEELIHASNVIKNGGTVIFPTETVYGIGANALNEDAVNKIFIAKGRPQDNPLIIHVWDYNIEKYVEHIPSMAKLLMERFWPGPLTIIFKKSKLIPSVTSANLDTIGIRMPNNKIALELIKLSGVPIAAPSANISGKPSCTEASRCIEDMDGRVDVILCGDKSLFGLESTIIDCTVEPFCILRPGAITLEELRSIDENIFLDRGFQNSIDEKPKAPGMKYTHYSPKAKVIIVFGENEKVVNKINELVGIYNKEGKSVGILCTDENINKYNSQNVISVGSVNDFHSIGRNLFETLRKFDDMNVNIILSESFKEEKEGIAIMNRLKKASGYNFIEV